MVESASRLLAQCSHGNPRSSKFCEACGTSLERVAAAERMANQLEADVLLATVLAPQLLDSADSIRMIGTVIVINTVVVAVWAWAHRRDVAGPLRELGERRYWGMVVAAVPITLALALAYVHLWLATDLPDGVEADRIGLYCDPGVSLPLVLLFVRRAAGRHRGTRVSGAVPGDGAALAVQRGVSGEPPPLRQRLALASCLATNACASAVA